VLCSAARWAICVSALVAGCSQKTNDLAGSGEPDYGAGGKAGYRESSGSAGDGSPADGAAGQTGVCSVARHVEVPTDATYLAGSPSPALAVNRVGERFAVAQHSDTGNALEIVSWAGLDSQFHCTSDCPSALQTGMGVGLISDAGDPRMLFVGSGVVAWTGGPTVTGPTPLYWTGQDAQDATGTVMFFRRGVQQLRASRDGQRALFGIGTAYFEPTVCLAELAGDASIPGGPQTMTLEQWECLDLLPTDTAGAVSLMVNPANRTALTWSVHEYDAAGVITAETAATVPLDPSAGLSQCPQVIDGPAGYQAYFAYDSSHGLLITLPSAGSNALPDARQVAGNGKLVGALDDELVFESVQKDGKTHFSGLHVNDAAPRDLVGLPVAVPAPQSAFVDADGRSLFISYQTSSARVFEEITCPE
jgi:hypothetical protein